MGMVKMTHMNVYGPGRDPQGAEISPGGLHSAGQLSRGGKQRVLGPARPRLGAGGVPAAAVGGQGLHRHTLTFDSKMSGEVSHSHFPAVSLQLCPALWFWWQHRLPRRTANH